MSLSVEMIRYQLHSAAWANRRILAAAGELTPEELVHDFRSSEKSILATLVHIYRAERVWAARLENTPVDFVTDGDNTMAALSENWPRLMERWAEWLKGLTEEGTAVEVTYHDLRNKQWTQPVWQLVMHVVNHSSHHRGQVSGFIRALGHTPPNVDSISFARGL